MFVYSLQATSTPGTKELRLYAGGYDTMAAFVNGLMANSDASELEANVWGATLPTEDVQWLFGNGWTIGLKHCVGCERAGRKFRKCSGCYAYFCSDECQGLRWPTHKTQCRELQRVYGSYKVVRPAEAVRAMVSFWDRHCAHHQSMWGFISEYEYKLVRHVLRPRFRKS